jgi:hypothetical protein
MKPRGKRLNHKTHELHEKKLPQERAEGAKQKMHWLSAIAHRSLRDSEFVAIRVEDFAPFCGRKISRQLANSWMRSG